MAGPALVVRVAANVEELKRNLAEGKDQIETTTAAMSKLASSLSGDKLIQNAHNIVAAIGNIENIAKLTSSEAERLGNTLGRAIEKAELTGRQLPEGMRAYHAELQKVAAASGTWQERLSAISPTLLSIGSAMGVAFSASAIINFTKSVFDAASQAKDLSDKMGVSIDAAQRFGFAAQQTGTSVDTVSNALTQMNNRLADGNSGTVAALSALGLKLNDIRAMGSEHAFLAIADAAQKIQDPMKQTQILMDLWGKSAAELLPAVKEGFADVAASATVMSDETVERLEAAQDAWEALGHSVVVMSGEVIAAIAGMNESWDALAKHTQQTGEMSLNRVRVVTEDIKKQVESMTAGAQATVGFTAAVGGLGQSQQDLLRIMKEADTDAKSLEASLRKNAKAAEDAARAAKQLQDQLDRKGLRELGRTMALDEFNRNLENTRDRFREVERAFYDNAKAAEATQAVWTAFTQSARSGIVELGTTVSLVIPQIQTGFQQAVGAMGNFAQTFGGELTGLLTNTAQTAWGIGRNFVATIGNTLVPGLGSLIGAAWPVIQKGLEKLWDGIQAFGRAVGNFFGSLFGHGPGEATNDIRDQWMAGMGGFQAMQTLIGQFNNDPELMRSFGQLYTAGNQQTFASGASAFTLRLQALGWRPGGSSGGASGSGGGGGFLPGEGAGVEEIPRFASGPPVRVNRPGLAYVDPGDMITPPGNASGGITVHLNISTIDGDGTKRWLRRGGARDIVEGIADELRRQRLA